MTQRQDLVEGDSPRAHNQVPLGVLAAIYLAVFVAMLDVSVVVLAVPAIQADLDASTGDTQWVMAGYTLCLSVLSISVGAAGDRYGRKRLFQTGVAIFVVGSLFCAIATSPGFLIAARIVQGVGGAIVVPGSLALLARAFTDTARRAKAIAGWSTVAACAALTGPVIGGLIVDTIGWRAIFLVNLPLGAAALALGWRFIRESADPQHTDLDLAGQLLGIGTLGALSYGLIHAGEHGWTAVVTLVSLGIAAVLFPIFIVVEARQPRPMLPVRLFTERQFALPMLPVLALGFSLLALGVFIPAYLQQAQHLTATQAGLLGLPGAAVAVATPFLTGRLLAKLGPTSLMIGGLIGAAGASLLLLAVTTDGSTWLIALVLVLISIAYGLAVPATNTAVLDAVHESRAGTVSAIIGAVRQTGTTLGIAVLGAILATQLTGPGTRTHEEAHTDAIHLMAATATGVTLITVVVILAFYRSTRQRKDKAPLVRD